MSKHLEDPDAALTNNRQTLCKIPIKPGKGPQTTEDPYQAGCRKCIKLFKKALFCAAAIAIFTHWGI